MTMLIIVAGIGRKLRTRLLFKATMTRSRPWPQTGPCWRAGFWDLVARLLV